jgi:hypothetical protein
MLENTGSIYYITVRRLVSKASAGGVMARSWLTIALHLFWEALHLFRPIETFPFATEGPPRVWSSAIVKIFILLAGALLVLSAALLFAWPFALAAFWDSVAQAAHSPWKRAAATATLALFGFLLYLARRFARLLYGAAETLVGIAFCWAGLGSVSAGSWTSVAGGIYVIIRGLDNCQQGATAIRSLDSESSKPTKADSGVD